jgi:RNA-directed DNA polymerase
MQTSLLAITEKAKREKRYRFRNLYQLLRKENLSDSLKYMNRRAAPGVDGYSLSDYEVNLTENINDLVKRLKENRYRTKLVKRVYIPKGNGKMRPLGLPSIEDKLVQTAVTRILGSIYETDFNENSFGYRSGRSAHDALEKIRRITTFEGIGTIVEADIKGFFDSINHDWLIKMLEQRIDDRPFLNLIRKWLKAGILNPDGLTVHPSTGTPQGGIVSPVLANVYLHYVLDLWFEKIVKKHCQGKAFLVRYADDFLCAFQNERDAERFFNVLPKRLAKFGLEVAPEKTKMLRFSKADWKNGEAFEFLGFEHRWIRSARGKLYVRRKTARKKFISSVRTIKEWCIKNRSIRLAILFPQLNRKLKGYYNYYGLLGNSKSIWKFYEIVVKLLFKWLNRRSQRWSYNREPFNKVLKYYRLVTPRVTDRYAR